MKIKSITEVPYDGFIYTPEVQDNQNYLFDNGCLSKNCQNQSPSSIQKTITRVGKNCKLVLVGSNNQIDNKFLTRYTNGLSIILEACTKVQEHVNIHAVNLKRVVRGPIAEWAEGVFTKAVR